MSGAAMSLHDRKYGTPGTLRLRDYSGRLGTANGVMQADIRDNAVDAARNGGAFCMHWCILPMEFQRGHVQYGTGKHLPGSEPYHRDRRSSHAFANTQGGTAWYSVTAKFFYGA